VNNQYFEQYLSTFIESNFPEFYQEEGPNFIAFVKAYYEWLERTDKYTVTINPSSNTVFKIGKNIICNANTSQQGFIVGTPDNMSIEFLGTNFENAVGSVISQIDEIDNSVAGIVNLTNNSRIVIGTGTSFLSDFIPGEYIYTNETAHKIIKIIDNNSLVISLDATETLAGLPYVRYIINSEAEVIAIYNTPNLIAASRRITEDGDVDETLEQFVQYFKTKYMASMPNNMMVSKRFLTKHIQDFYRSKGSQRAYELLFRILFNEDVSIYLPSLQLFAPSESEWFIQRYIEISDTPYLNELINQEIYSSSLGATATVEYVFKKTIKGKQVTGLILSNIEGTFHYGERILSTAVPQIIPQNAPFISGSLSAISMTNGGSGFSIGDVLEINDGGEGGLAVVTSVTNSNGKTSFFLEDGGSGYSMNASIIIDSTNTGGAGASFEIGDLTNTETISVTNDLILNYVSTVLENVANTFTVNLTGVSGTFQVNELVKSSINVVPMDVTVVSGLLANSETVSNGSITARVGRSDLTYLEVTGNTGAFVPEMILVGNTSGATVSINSIFPTRNVQANAMVSAVVGSNLTLKNCYSYTPNYSVVLSASASSAGTGYANGEIVIFTGGGGTGATAQITTSDTGSIAVVDMRNNGINYTSLPTATINTANGSGATIVPVRGYLAGYPYPNAVLTGQTSGALGTISTVTRLTNWNFPYVNIPDVENMNTSLANIFTYHDIVVGSIRYITAINSGIGYAVAPKVKIQEPYVIFLSIPDNAGNIKGNNAIVSSTAGYARGIVTSVRLVDSGFGYTIGDTLYLSNANNNSAVYGDSIIDQQGISAGYWKNRKSFPSEEMYIQDSHYYQRFSYDIQASRMIDTYRSFVEDLIHPAGLALFGTFVKTDMKAEPSRIVETSLVQT